MSVSIGEGLVNLIFKGGGVGATNLMSKGGSVCLVIFIFTA